MRMFDKELEVKNHIDYEKSFKIVGEFLFQWNYLELKLDQAIEKLLGINVVQSVLLLNSLNFLAKCKILRHSVKFTLPELLHNRVICDLKKIEEINKIRNKIVHNCMTPSNDGKSIKFWYKNSKNPKLIEDHEISHEKFENLYIEINELSNSLNEIVSLINITEDPEFEKELIKMKNEWLE